MAVIRVDNYIAAYGLRSQSKDIHELAARPDKKHLTDFVNRRILEALHPGAEDFLVDIGCGDASLLRMIAESRVKSVGIVATKEEESRLQSAFPGLLIKAGDARSLPLETGIATKVVCNAMLHYLPSEAAVRAALGEIKRVSRSSATIWIGEVPEIDEYSHFGIYRGTSMLGFLWHLLRRNGTRSFFGMIRRWVKAVFGREQIVLNSAGMFYATPDRMRDMAETCGLRLTTFFRHKEVDARGGVLESRFRYDYLFTV